jgi:hypothetical protein
MYSQLFSLNIGLLRLLLECQHNYAEDVLFAQCTTKSSLQGIRYLIVTLVALVGMGTYSPLPLVVQSGSFTRAFIMRAFSFSIWLAEKKVMDFPSYSEHQSNHWF